MNLKTKKTLNKTNEHLKFKQTFISLLNRNNRYVRRHIFFLILNMTKNTTNACQNRRKKQLETAVVCLPFFLVLIRHCDGIMIFKCRVMRAIFCTVISFRVWWMRFCVWGFNSSDDNAPLLYKRSNVSISNMDRWMHFRIITVIFLLHTLLYFHLKTQDIVNFTVLFLKQKYLYQRCNC